MSRATVLAICSLLLVFYLGLATSILGLPSDHGELGSLINGASLFGVVAAILLQSRELELQRSEITQNRQVLRRSARAQEHSAVHAREAVQIAALVNHASALRSDLTSVTSALEAERSEALRARSLTSYDSDVPLTTREGELRALVTSTRDSLEGVEGEIRRLIDEVSTHGGTDEEETQ